MEIQRCDRLAHAKEYSEPKSSVWEIPRLVESIRESNACLSLKTLAVKGGDLASIGVTPGKEMGKLLAALLEKVIDGDLPNEKSALLEYAKTIK